MKTRELLPVWVAAATMMIASSLHVHAIEFVPLRDYRDAEDSPFADFGLVGSALIIEDFEDRDNPAPGLILQSNNASRVVDEHSVDEGIDGASGNAFEVVAGGACTATFPQQCPTTLTIEFDEQSFTQLPSYVGFVWTDAVRRAEEDVHPWIGIDITNGDGEVAANRIFDFPVRSTLESDSADDTLFSFVDESGIRSVEITMTTNGREGSPRLVIDHIQYGVATLPGDTNRDGTVDFQDFLNFSAEFGNDASSWGEGDFTFDGRTDFFDLLKLSENFGERVAGVDIDSLSTRGGIAGVPEPSSVHLLLLAAAVAFGCRRAGAI